MSKVERELRDKVKALEEVISDKDTELGIYRTHFSTRFKWWIELLGSWKSPSLPWLIEHDAKVLHGLKSWWW